MCSYCSFIAMQEHEYASLFYCVCELNHKWKRLTNLDKCLWHQRCVDWAHSTLTYEKVLFASSIFRNFSIGEDEYFCLLFYFIQFGRYFHTAFLFCPFNNNNNNEKSDHMRLWKWIFSPLRSYSFRLFVIIIEFVIWMCFFSDISFYLQLLLLKKVREKYLSFLFCSFTLFTFLIWVPGN